VEHGKECVLQNMLVTVDALPELKSELLATMEAKLSQMVFTIGFEFECPQCTEQAKAKKSDAES
jgi:hypothetical protein